MPVNKVILKNLDGTGKQIGETANGAKQLPLSEFYYDFKYLQHKYTYPHLFEYIPRNLQSRKAQKILSYSQLYLVISIFGCAENTATIKKQE